MDKKDIYDYIVAAVVVLYFPDESVYDNINSYINQVDIVILVDNTDNPGSSIIEKFSSDERVVPIVNGANLGIANALNIGAQEAILRGCDLLLTMDQDSCASSGMVATLKEGYIALEDDSLAIVSPFHLTSIVNAPDSSLPKYEEVESVWTSGNLLRLSLYKDIGTFKEDLFIDFVDHEYCLRLKRKGYRVVQSNFAILRHNIGTNLREIRFCFVSLKVSNHSSLRRYYITRNRFWVTREYKEFRKFCLVDLCRFWAEFFTIGFFEKNKFAKFKMIILGYWDYRIGKMGKFESFASRNR